MKGKIARTKKWIKLKDNKKKGVWRWKKRKEEKIIKSILRNLNKKETVKNRNNGMEIIVWHKSSLQKRITKKKETCDGATIVCIKGSGFWKGSSSKTVPSIIQPRGGGGGGHSPYDLLRTRVQKKRRKGSVFRHTASSGVVDVFPEKGVFFSSLSPFRGPISQGRFRPLSTFRTGSRG